MQWRDATVGGEDTTGFEVFGSQIRPEPDVRQVQVGNIGQTSEVSVATQNQFMVAGPIDGTTALPIGLDLPCTEDPELFFAESPQHVEQAKAMCRDCRARIACLTGALERREPWGVWGGELFCPVHADHSRCVAGRPASWAARPSPLVRPRARPPC